MMDYEYGLPLSPHRYDSVLPAAFKIFGNSDYGSNNDIIASIIDLMPYRDLRNFALSCRLFFELSQPIVQKRYHGKKFFNITAQDPRHIHKLLTLATKNQTILQCVQNVMVYDQTAMIDSSEEPSKSLRKKMESMHQAYQLGWSLIRSQGLDPPQPGEYERRMKSGGAHWAIVLLLLCPNIQELGLGVSVADYYGHVIVPSLNSSHSNSVPWKTVPLLKLSHLTLQGTLPDDHARVVSIDTVLRIASTPSLRTLKLYDLHIDRTDTVHVGEVLPWNAVLKTKYVVIIDCRLAPSTAAAIVESAPDLEYFELGGNAHFWPGVHGNFNNTLSNTSTVVEPFLNDQGVDISMTWLGQYGKRLKRELGPTLLERGLNTTYVGTGEPWEWNSRIFIRSKQVIENQGLA